MQMMYPSLTNTNLVRVSIIVTSLLLAMTAVLPYAGAVDGGAPPARMTNLAWHDGDLWNSVVLGTLHGNPNPNKLDAFYTFGTQKPVAGAGPGDTDYHGGRWQAFSCTGGGSFTDGDQVEAAINSLIITCTPVGTPFLCPLTNRNA